MFFHVLPWSNRLKYTIILLLLLLRKVRCLESPVDELSILTESESDELEAPVADDSMRGCECWRWPECSGNCTVNSLLKHTIRSEHRILATLAVPFVLMFPYQDRKSRSKYGTSTSGKRGTYFGTTKFWIHMPNQQHVQLRIQKSRILSGQDVYTTVYYQRNNDGQVHLFESDKYDQCFYTGTVHGDHAHFSSNSYVAVDTCYGLRGLIYMANQTFGLYPLHCATCQPELLPHVVFPLLSTPIERDAKLSVFWRPTDVLAQKPPRPKKKLVENSYTLRLSFLVDHHLFSAFEKKLEKSVHYVGSVINQATKSFQGLPIELRWIRSEVWNLNDRFSMNLSIKATLNHLAAYATYPGRTLSNSTGLFAPTASSTSSAWWRLRRRHAELASSVPAVISERSDLVILLTTTQFSDAVEYLAIPDSICTPRSLAVIQVNLSETAYHTSRLLSLAIADVLGLKSFPCPPRYSCSSEELLSDGDKARIRLALFSGMADCLVGDASGYRVDTCGNGRLDRGEECDTGHLQPTANASSMPCCNPGTCLSDVGAVCTHGACCTRCRLAGEGQLCRPARDQCDLPEFCDGVQPHCPADLYLENGSPCRTQTATVRQPRSFTSLLPVVEQSSVDETKALCYQGRCPTRDSQCQSIWGSGSSKAADYCFVVHNTRTAGACGVRGENCPNEHAMCGLLHCQGGEPRPVSQEVALSGQPFLTYTEHKGKQFECKHLSHISTVRFVPEGAACAENRYCFRQQCVSPHVALLSRCPSGIALEQANRNGSRPHNSTCSNRGVCTNGGFCLCFPGWTGESCNLPQSTARAAQNTHPIVSVPSSLSSSEHLICPDQKTAAKIWTYMEHLQRLSDETNFALNQGAHPQLNSFYLAIILGSVVGGIFIFLTLFLVIYRRQSHSRFSRKSSRSRCLSLSRQVIPRSSVGSTQLPFDPVPPHSAYLESADLKYTALASNRDSLSCPSHPPDKSYFSRWAHDRRHSSGDRSSRRKRDTSDHQRERRRRRRKHYHREDDEYGRKGRRSAKYSDGSPALERINLTDYGGMNHSDTELTFHAQQWLDEESNSNDRIIKFGSMPSYKEDKLKRSKPSNNRTSSHSLNARCEVGTAQPDLNNSITCWATSNATTGTATNVHDFANNFKLSAETPQEIMAVSPLYTRAAASGLPGITEPLDSGDTVWPETSYSQNVISSCGSPADTQRVVPSKCVTTSSPAMSNFKDNIPTESTDISVETQLNLLMENSWRQPEKGILKNKHEGGSRTSRTTTAPAHQSSEGSTKHDRHRHRHGHHRKSRRCQRESAELKERYRADSPCSRCSYCSNGRDNRSRNNRRMTREKTPPTTEAPRNQLVGYVERGQSSDSTGSSTSHSSTASSFDSKCNKDLPSSFSSSTTSTCSTALEVGPDGNVRRLVHAHERGFIENEQTRTKSNYERLASCSRHANNKDDHSSSSNDAKRYCRHRHHHHSRRKRCLRDSEVDAQMTNTINTPVSESTGSSSLGNGTNGTPSLSGASSSSSSAGRHFHRRRRLRTRRNTDDDATSCSHRSSPPVPTILCNAGQQTDETSILSASGLADHTVPAIAMTNTQAEKSSTKHTTDESDCEWEEVECNESACEECQSLICPKNQNKQLAQSPDNFSTSALGVTVTSMLNPVTGHTNPAYVQSLSSRQNGEVNTSNPSIVCQQQSTASSSLSSAKNSRMGTPAFSPQQNTLPTSYSPHGGSFVMGNTKAGIANRAASSSSCSSSSAAGQSMKPCARPPVTPGKGLCTEDHTSQHSETEVDAHLQLLSSVSRPQRTFYYPANAIPKTSQYPAAPTSAYVPLQQPFPVIGLGSGLTLGSQLPIHCSPRSRAVPIPAVQAENRDNCYQHPYEDVATDEYAEALNGRLAQVQRTQQHIYHQHGLPQASASSTANGGLYSSRDEDEDDQLSLDEDHSTHGSNITNPTGVFGRYDVLSGSGYAPRMTEGGMQQTWLTDGSGTEFREVEKRQHRSQRVQFPGSQYPINQVSRTEPHVNLQKSHLTEVDDGASDFSLSAFRRDDIRIPFHQSRNDATSANNMFHPVTRNCTKLAQHTGLHGSSEHGTEGHSNDGTCDGSDTSSLPEAGCDLVQLALLDVSGRPNPMLSDLARQRQQTSLAWIPNSSG